MLIHTSLLRERLTPSQEGRPRTRYNARTSIALFVYTRKSKYALKLYTVEKTHCPSSAQGSLACVRREVAQQFTDSFPGVSRPTFCNGITIRLAFSYVHACTMSVWLVHHDPSLRACTVFGAGEQLYSLPGVRLLVAVNTFLQPPALSRLVW